MVPTNIPNVRDERRCDYKLSSRIRKKENTPGCCFETGENICDDEMLRGFIARSCKIVVYRERTQLT